MAPLFTSIHFTSTINQMDKKVINSKKYLPVPRLEYWFNHLKKFNYRMVGGILTKPETVGGGANQGFGSMQGMVTNIVSQASFKGVTATFTKEEVKFYAGSKLLMTVPVFKVKKPR